MPSCLWRSPEFGYAIEGKPVKNLQILKELAFWSLVLLLYGFDPGVYQYSLRFALFCFFGETICPTVETRKCMKVLFFFSKTIFIAGFWKKKNEKSGFTHVLLTTSQFITHVHTSACLMRALLGKTLTSTLFWWVSSFSGANGCL